MSKEVILKEATAEPPPGDMKVYCEYPCYPILPENFFFGDKENEALSVEDSASLGDCLLNKILKLLSFGQWESSVPEISVCRLDRAVCRTVEVSCTDIRYGNNDNTVDNEILRIGHKRRGQHGKRDEYGRIGL